MMITITGPLKEVQAIQSLIDAASPAASLVLTDRAFVAGGDADATYTFRIETQADRDAANRAFVLALPGRHTGTIDRWRAGSSYGYTTQHDGLGEALGGRDLIIFHEDILGAGYGNQPTVGAKITYQRVSGPKGLRATAVCLIDNPKSVTAFIKAMKTGSASREIAPRRHLPSPVPAQSYQRAKPGESSFKGEVKFNTKD